MLQNGYEVMVKITSNARNFSQIAAHIQYISCNGEVELIDSEILQAKGQDCEMLLYNFALNPSPPNKEKRETYNIVMSMRDYDECDTKSLKAAAFATIKNLYPNNYFALALHTDTDNPHCHICLKSLSDNGKRLHIQKKALAYY